MNWYRIASLICFVLFWYCITKFGLVGLHLLPTPFQVLSGLKELIFLGMPPGHLLGNHILYSLQRVLLGYCIAMTAAVPLGVAIGWHEGFRHFMEPLIEMVRPIPPLAWIPISILWFGIGLKSSAFIIFLGAFFPILLNTISSIREVDPLYVDVGRSLNASPMDIMLKILVPAAIPGIITGMRIGVGIGWMSLVAAEFCGVSKGYGLGYMIMTARDVLRADQLLAGMLVIGAIGLGVDHFFRYAEQRLNRR